MIAKGWFGRHWITVVLVVGFVLLVGIAAWLMLSTYMNGKLLSDKLGGPEEFGQFGDYVGGLFNPIFGFLSVVLLIIAAMHTRKQASLAQVAYDSRELELALERVLADQQANWAREYESGIVMHPTSYKSFKEAWKNDCSLVKNNMEAAYSSKHAAMPFKIIVLNLAQLLALTSLVLKRSNEVAFRYYWFGKIEQAIDFYVFIGLYPAEKAKEVKSLLKDGGLDDKPLSEMKFSFNQRN